MKKFAMLLLTICLGCVFASCSDFFEPLPDDFFNDEKTETSVVVPDSENTSEEPTDGETPDDGEEVPVEPETPVEPSEPEEPDTPTEPTEPTEPSEPSEPETPVEPEEPTEPDVVEPVVSEALVFTEGVHVLENLSITCDEDDRAAIYAEGAGTVVVIESGVYYGGTGESSAPAVYARDGAKIIINGGTFGTGVGNATVYAKNYAYVEINGGEFTADGAWEGNYYVLNLADNTNSKILVKGGKFKDFDPANNASENPAVSFVANGYESVLLEENWFEVKEIVVVEE